MRSRSTTAQAVRVAVLRTFSKIYGLAGLRVGYMVAPPAVVTAANKVKRAFDVSSAAQEAALASLDDVEEISRRRRAERGVARPARGDARRGRLRAAGPAVAQLPLRRDRRRHRPLFEALLAEGVIVRPLHGFGAPTAIRVTCGTPDENEFFAEALARVRDAAPRRVNVASCRSVLPASGRCSARRRASGCSSAPTLVSGLGTWIAVVALVIDVEDRTTRASGSARC